MPRHTHEKTCRSLRAESLRAPTSIPSVLSAAALLAALNVPVCGAVARRSAAAVFVRHGLARARWCYFAAAVITGFLLGCEKLTGLLTPAGRSLAALAALCGGARGDNYWAGTARCHR